MGWGLETISFTLSNGITSPKAGKQNSKLDTIAITAPIREISMKHGTYGLMGLRLTDIHDNDIYNEEW